MDTNLNIFLLDKVGMLWIHSAKDLSEAETKISDISKNTPGIFLVFSHITLERTRYSCAPDGTLKRLSEVSA